MIALYRRAILASALIPARVFGATSACYAIHGDPIGGLRHLSDTNLAPKGLYCPYSFGDFTRRRVL